MTDQQIDLIYKMAAATGMLLDYFGEAEQMGVSQVIFTQSLKNTATKFRQGLAMAEGKITGYEGADRPETMNQMADSYHLADRLITINLQAGRKLTEQARLILESEIEELCKKYGVI